ncbi:probable transcription factor At1g44810 [Triticum urartu]|uniref:probable transcription factor At1g44810 n=1 Tax=Triticum urartu TaxID=4572 RepID=UPI002044A345|nr:probable transcription factor At1g44810 [Triticum urartu]
MAKSAAPPPPSSPQTSSHLYLLTQSQHQDTDPEVEQPRPDDDVDDADDEPAKKRARARREWAASDEVTILEALIAHRRQHSELPERSDNDFFQALAERLEDTRRQPLQIKDKVKSLERRYFSATGHRRASSSSHDKRLNQLSAEIWGDLPLDDDGSAHVGNNGGGDRRAKMCKMFPLVAQKVNDLAQVQPAVKRLFPSLADAPLRLLENRLEKIRWSEMNIDVRLERMLLRASKRASTTRASKKDSKKKKK